MTQRRASKTKARMNDQPAYGGRLVPVVAIVLAAGFIGYVGLNWFQTQNRESAAPSIQPVAPVAGLTQPSSYPVPGEQAPDFTVDTLEHGRFTLSDQRGKPTVVFFTASYCLPCIPQMQALARIQEQVDPAKLSVLVLDVDPSEGIPGLRQLKTVTAASYPFALDVGNRVTLLYGVRALDTKMYVSRDGVLVDRVDGIAESEGQLRSRVEGLLRGS